MTRGAEIAGAHDLVLASLRVGERLITQRVQTVSGGVLVRGGWTVTLQELDGVEYRSIVAGTGASIDEAAHGVVEHLFGATS